MKIWAVTCTELGGAEGILYDADQHMVFADTTDGYNAALAAWNRFRDDLLSFYTVGVIGTHGENGRAQLNAYDGDDSVTLRTYEVIGS